MEVIGSTVTFVEPAPLLTKRKATEDGSPRPLKSLKVDSVRIDNTFVEQFIGGAFSSSYLNLFTYRIFPCFLAGATAQSYGSSVARVIKQVNRLLAADELTELGPGLVSTEVAHRNELIRLLNRIHGDVQTFNRTKDLYIATVKSMLE